ncbi:hypothetical protein [Methanomassiliicoccus luminyensis]|uniref:hypothetical protein n=1 Tax=Methanomassiliicoccus luminyensis TaxID=1080712 RepID=UPI0011CB2353|nr:hypothetical protein [Methanomassiliicoccus luminyensis]
MSREVARVTPIVPCGKDILVRFVRVSCDTFRGTEVQVCRGGKCRPILGLPEINEMNEARILASSHLALKIIGHPDYEEAKVSIDGQEKLVSKDNMPEAHLCITD